MLLFIPLDFNKPSPKFEKQLATKNALAASQWSSTQSYEFNAEQYEQLQNPENPNFVKKKKKKKEQQPAFQINKFEFKKGGITTETAKVETTPLVENEHQLPYVKPGDVQIDTSNQPAPMGQVSSHTGIALGGKKPIGNLPKGNLNKKELGRADNSSREAYYTKPDPLNFLYDPDSGYMYDPTTGYYYDKHSETYYDGEAWLIWNDKTKSYTPKPKSEAEIKAEMKQWEKEQKKKLKQKASERQAETLRLDEVQNEHLKAVAAVKDFEAEGKKKEDSSNIPLDNDVDWNELICNLCRRGFGTKDKLSRHVNESKLHKSNFAVKYGVSSKEVVSQVMDPTVQKVLEITAQQRQLEYKDGMDNRTERYNEAHKDVSNRAREKRIGKNYKPDGESASVHKAIDVSKNIGGKLMAKMGWQEGQALGATGVGIMEPINATEERAKRAGLGHSDADKKKGSKAPRTKRGYMDATRAKAQERFRDLF